MTILTFLLSASALVIVLSGIYFLLHPESARRLTPRWTKTGIAVNLLLFVVGIAAFLRVNGVQRRPDLGAVAVEESNVVDHATPGETAVGSRSASMSRVANASVPRTVRGVGG